MEAAKKSPLNQRVSCALLVVTPSARGHAIWRRVEHPQTQREQRDSQTADKHTHTQIDRQTDMQPDRFTPTKTHSHSTPCTQDPFLGYEDVLRRHLDLDFLKTHGARVVEECVAWRA